MDHNDTEIEDLQIAAIEVSNAIEEIDRDFLAAMTPEQRAQQLHTRDVLYDYFDRLWDVVKLRDLARDDGELDTPDVQAVMGIRDLTASLQGMAMLAKERADDDPNLEVATDLRAHDRDIWSEVQTWVATASYSELKAARFTVNPAAVLHLAEAWQERHR